MDDERKDDIVETRIQITREARDALDRLSASRKRKGELINDLLLAAAARAEEIKSGNAPLDGFTKALIRAEVMREQREA